MPSPSKATISLSNVKTSSTISLSCTIMSSPLATEISSKHTSEDSSTSSNDSSTRPTKVMVDNISVIYCNYQGLLRLSRIKYGTGEHHIKLDKVREILTSSNPSNIFCITETQLGPSIDDKEIYIENYTINRADCNRQGGGVAIYCHNKLQPKQVIFPDLKSIEFVCVKISVVRGHHVIISCIYRPPNSPRAWLDSFYGLTNNILCDSTACIILGDFNENLLRSSQFADESHSTFGLTQHINNPARVTEKKISNSLTMITVLISQTYQLKLLNII